MALVIIDELRRCGVSEVVLCPGSRSAPLAYALHAATAEDTGEAASKGVAPGHLRVHVRIDERSAGFLALGLAKASRNPVAVVTTSGTAVANLHPAVVEADLAGVPLLLLTADRPPQARDTGANQTIRQRELFGPHVRWAAEAAACLAGALPSDSEQQARLNAGWRALVGRAVAASRSTGPACSPSAAGPVHLNLPFDTPLVPPDLHPETLRLPEPLQGRAHQTPWVQTPAGASTPHGQPPGPTLVVIGDVEPGLAQQALGWAHELHHPVVAEPVTAAAWLALPAGALLLGEPAWMAVHRPQRVMLVGRPTLDRPTQELLANPNVRVETVAPQGWWQDSVAQIHADFPEESAGDPAYLASWQHASRTVAKVVEQRLCSDQELSGLHVASVVQHHLGTHPDSLLVVGSSSVVRDLQLVCGGLGEAAHPPHVMANRGAAGIDGMVSTAIGAALASPTPGPAVALMGDLSFAHDATALLHGPDQPQPQLDLVVVNDGGGSIFARLEPGQAQLAQAFEPLFATPVRVDFAALCAASNTPHVRVHTVQHLLQQLKGRAQHHRGVRVIEVVVSRAHVRTQHQHLRQQVHQALITLGQRPKSDVPATTIRAPR